MIPSPRVAGDGVALQLGILVEGDVVDEDRWLPDTLPRDLRERAVRDGGLPAWELGDAIRVAEAAPGAGLAILGGEVWWLLDNGGFHNLMPVPGIGWGELEEWDLDPITRQPSESWSGYCERSARFTLEMLARLGTTEESLDPRMRSRLRYHLALWTPEWYGRAWGGV